jgi:hypothetical protein
MKRTLLLLLAIVVLAWTAWLMNGPRPVQADDVPEKYRDTIQKGLEYLAKKQSKDGHWEGDGGAHPVAMTGLVGLALLMEPKRPSSHRFGGSGDLGMKPSKYAAEIHRAADWLIDQSGADRDGLLFTGHESERSRYMQGHGLATILLAGVVLGEGEKSQDKKYKEALRRAMSYIVKSQSSRGGWYDTSKTEGHDFDSIQATVIQIQALQAASNAGIPAPDAVIRDAKEYLESFLEKADKQKKPGDTKLAADAAAALAGFFAPRPQFARLGRGDQDYLRERWEKFCDAELPIGNATKFGRDELAHCYLAEEQTSIGGDSWSTYRAGLFDALQSHQNKDGSWPAGDGISVGPVYSTAVWCIVLQLDRKNHPSLQQIEFAAIR